MTSAKFCLNWRLQAAPDNTAHGRLVHITNPAGAGGVPRARAPVGPGGQGRGRRQGRQLLVPPTQCDMLYRRCRSA
jgi:hypothetical protein